MGKGEVQKGFLVVLLILGAAVLVSYLNNDGTGYASSSLRGSSGIDSPQTNNCECSSPDKKTETSNILCIGGTSGIETCEYTCIKGFDACTPVWEKQHSTSRPDGTQVTETKYRDGKWRLQSCTTDCRYKTLADYLRSVGRHG